MKDIPVYGELYRFLPVLAFQRGYKISEIQIRHEPRKYGKSKYGIMRFIHGFLDFLTVFMLTKYTEKPAHFFGGAGIISFFAGLGICGYMTFLWFLGYRPIGNRPLFFLGILLLIVSIQLISLGLLGEMYINKDPKVINKIREIL